MHDRVKACCAGFYELPIVSALLGSELHPGGPALTRELARAALVGRESTVLDIACGQGESARLLAGHFGCRSIGVDYSKESIARAVALTKQASLSARVGFVQGDAEGLPFDAESFHVALCECSLCTFPDLSAALAEMRRVLKPGGRVGISDVVLNEAVPESLQNVLGRALCISGALSINGYREALDSAGFSAIRCRDVSSVLVDMVARIERRIRTMDRLLDGEQVELPGELRISPAEITDARDFVKAGGIGYALISARRPRDSGANEPL